MDALNFSVFVLLFNVLSQKVDATNTSTPSTNYHIENPRITVVDFKVFVSWKTPSWWSKNITYKIQLCSECSHEALWSTQTCNWTFPNETTTCEFEVVKLTYKPVPFRIKICTCADCKCSSNVNLTDLFVNKQSKFSAPNLTAAVEGNPGSFLIVSRIPSIHFLREFRSVQHKVDIVRLPQGMTCDSKKAKSLESFKHYSEVKDDLNCDDYESGVLRYTVSNLTHAGNYCVWASYLPHDTYYKPNESPKSYATVNVQHVPDNGLALKVALIGTLSVVTVVGLLFASRKAVKRIKRFGSFQPSKTLLQLFDDNSIMYEKGGDPYKEYPVHENVDKVDFQLLRKENESRNTQLNKGTVTENPYIRLSTVFSCLPETFLTAETEDIETLSESSLSSLVDEEPRTVIVNGRKFILNSKKQGGQYATK